MVRLLVVRLLMVPHRGVPVVAVHVRERNRRGSERSYDDDGKRLLENLFHENPGGSTRESDEKRDAIVKPLRCADILAHRTVPEPPDEL
jgi:hypothetical protein